MKRSIIGITLGILIYTVTQKPLIAQQNNHDAWDKLEFSGYLSSTQSAMFEDLNEAWVIDNQLHNRLNFHWYGSPITASVQIRNRLLFGDQIRMSMYNSTSMLETDRGWMDMAWNLSSGNSYAMNTTIDRAWLLYTRNNIDVTLGRQRINWGQSMVWNPNDIFNAYSFFDFDYPERPGSDAVRLQYYPNYTSTLEFAAKIDSYEKVTTALMGRFNIREYDLQGLLGVLAQEDYVLGLGWAGNIKNITFTGEGTYIHPMENPTDTSGVFLMSMGGGYTFENSLFIQVEGLYSKFENASISGFQDYYSTPLSVKNLAFTEISFFAQATYPITPLFNATLATMYYPRMDGYFFGPSIDYSLGDNLTLSVLLQSFSGKFPLPNTSETVKQTINIGFLRFKINF